MSLVQRRFKLFVVIFLVSRSILTAWVDSQPVSANSDDTTEFFEKQIRPILMTNCSPCHNPQAYVAKLDLTTAEGFARGGESGALINPADPEKSRLLKVIGYSETLKMPPKGKLGAGEIAALTEWVGGTPSGNVFRGSLYQLSRVIHWSGASRTDAVIQSVSGAGANPAMER